MNPELTVTAVISPTQIIPIVLCGKVPFGAANWIPPRTKAAMAQIA